MLNKTLEVGNLDLIPFAKKTFEFDKIRSINENDLKVCLGLVFTKIVHLLSIKNPLDDFNKQDIKEMLLTKFKNISIEEINYAFKLERYGSLEPRSEHYQNFNAVYVSEVLHKYKKWLTKIRQDNNLRIAKEEAKKELTQEEKDLIVWQGVVDCFEGFKSNKKITSYCRHIYQHLNELKLLDYSGEQKREIMKLAKKRLQDEAQNQSKYLKNSNLFKQLRDNEKDLVTEEAIKMTLEDYFGKVLEKGLHIKNLIP